MAKTASAPLPAFGHASPERVSPRQVPLEERVAVLETRSQFIAERADVKGAENRMILWILGAGLALAGLSFAMFARLDSAMTANIARLDAAITANTARIDKLDAKIDARFDALMADNRATNARIDRLDAKLDAIMAELRTLNRPQ